jgi:pantoate--beta-alanine ligase
MKVFTTVESLRLELYKHKQKEQKLAFIPTMGALHNGHISLLQIAKLKKCISIVSIFVNPSQFNNAVDLAKYPRTFDIDSQLLKKENCDIIFYPSVDEIYPKDLHLKLNLDLKGLDQNMEGIFRPGHFMGMLEVVHRLLTIVEPDFIIMGQKDFQQFSLVNVMINQLHIPVKLIIGPTLREKDGLAMSSRNHQLTAENRAKASIIYKTLQYLKRYYTTLDSENLRERAWLKLQKVGFVPEYIEIVDGNTLKPLKSSEKSAFVVVCIACWAGNVRLIDNLIVNGDLK